MFEKQLNNSSRACPKSIRHKIYNQFLPQMLRFSFFFHLIFSQGDPTLRCPNILTYIPTGSTHSPSRTAALLSPYRSQPSNLAMKLVAGETSFAAVYSYTLFPFTFPWSSHLPMMLLATEPRQNSLQTGNLLQTGNSLQMPYFKPNVTTQTKCSTNAPLGMFLTSDISSRLCQECLVLSVSPKRGVRSMC